MPITEPPFWYRAPGAISAALSPAGEVYAAIGRLRRRRADPPALPCPLICVGNLVAGGSGKTPIALDLAQRLAHQGWTPAILSRGHGGQLRGPLRVDPAVHRAAQVGDEPLLHARACSAWVARDRAKGALAAAADGADVVIMDDGLQNPTVRPDLPIVVVDGRRGFGNGRVIPAGPLREPIDAGLARAVAAIIVGPDTAGCTDRIAPNLDGPILTARFEPADDVHALSGMRVVAFAGIAQPNAFFQMIRDGGADLAFAQSFPDHHRFSRAEIAALQARATRLGARLVTTEKDQVRLPPAAAGVVTTVSRRLIWDDPAAIDALVAAALIESDAAG